MLNPILVYGSEPGGQLTTTTDVENYPGFAHVIQGPWLMDQMKEQAKAVGTEMIEDHVGSVNLKSTPFEVVVIVVKSLLLTALLSLQVRRRDG